MSGKDVAKAINRQIMDHQDCKYRVTQEMKQQQELNIINAAQKDYQANIQAAFERL